MSYVEAAVTCIDVVNVPKKSVRTVANAYKVDFSVEWRRRWMVAGVLCAVALAVLEPQLGAPGGALRTQYLSYLPLSYIYYSAGATCDARALVACASERARVLALCCAHAHVVAPALCAAVLTAFRDGVDYRIVKGSMLSSVCGGCSWLSLAMGGGAGGGGAACACAASYVMSLLVAPLLCGLSAMPPLSSILLTAVTSVTPFAAGVYWGGLRRDLTARRVSALCLLYAECCDRLSAAAGVLRLGDVLVTLTLVLCWLSLVAASCRMYARCGLLEEADSRLVLACALPKSMHYWQSSATCCLTGLARLPAAFLAPAQALLLAALLTDEQDDHTTDTIKPTCKQLKHGNFYRAKIYKNNITVLNT